MAFLFNKFQEFVKTIAKNRMLAKDSRRLQFEADMNRLFLYTRLTPNLYASYCYEFEADTDRLFNTITISYNRLGKNADEADVDEIIDMASKAPIGDQEKLVQENVHSQIKSFSLSMDEILLPESKEQMESSQRSNPAPRRSGLSLAVGTNISSNHNPDTPRTKQMKLAEVSQKLKDRIGHTLDIRPSQIPHKEAGQGLFLNGKADVGSVLAIYPGVIYSPAYYRYIPGYPKVDSQNPYLITRYDATVINGQPWGMGGDETHVSWDSLTSPVVKVKPNLQSDEKSSDRVWRFLSKPLKGKPVDYGSDVIERRNPLALAHYANHPPKGTSPNVMICPYDFPLTEKDMRVYIPNVVFGNLEEASMKRLGSFWFKYGSLKDSESNVPLLKTIVLVATRAMSDEEVLLNYRLSNLKRRPEWYIPVDEEEDQRRWS